MRIFEIKSNDPDEPIVTITLSGEGVEDLPVPDIEVNPANIDFDEVDVGASSKATVTVSNRGEADLTVNAFGPDGGCTDIQSNVLVDPIPDLPLVIPPVVIAPGQSGDVVFTFHPTQVGECTRVFRIESDDPNEGLAEITLTGAGVAIPILDLDVLLTPKNFVAFKGGTIEYQVVINNNTGVQQTFDFWVDVTLPNGTIFPSVGALLGPFRLVLAPSGTILEMIIHNIPRNALSGAHKLNATVGNFPASTVFDQAIFEFFIPQ
jgi:hypothetical protein